MTRREKRGHRHLWTEQYREKQKQRKHQSKIPIEDGKESTISAQEIVISIVTDDQPTANLDSFELDANENFIGFGAVPNWVFTDAFSVGKMRIMREIY